MGSIRQFVIASTLLIAGIVNVAAQEAESKPAARPCETFAELSQFEFWLGSWDVHMEDGRKVGENHVTREQGGCVLVERWTNSRGGTGMSVNYYDPTAQQWVQNWIGADGSIIDIRGGLTADGSIALEGFIQNIGQDTRNHFRGRWTLLEDGRVRQYFEESADGGKTWQDSFLGFYTRQGDGH